MLSFLKLLIVILALDVVHAFGFQMPNFRMPWDKESNSNSGIQYGNGSKALKPGDTVAVVGASGNVGKLVALRLSDTYNVNGIVRDASTVSSFFEGREQIKLFEADLLNELDHNVSSGGCPESLKLALENANAIVVCTGTTAFPTKAWSRNEEKEITSDVIGALFESKFDVKSAISLLDSKKLNTPTNVDAKGNKLILAAWNAACKVQQKRAILLSSIGVQRRNTMPFPILNACGVLDAKAVGEQAFRDQTNYSYTIIRPGQLFGGPYDNNYYLGTLFQLDKDSDTRGVQMEVGDTLLGDTLRSTLAEITAQICETDSALNMDFAVVNVKGDAPSIDDIQMQLKQLQNA